MLSKIRLYVRRLMGRIPEPLPRTGPDLERFISDTLSLYGLPQNLSHQRAIVSMLQHVGQERYKAPKFFFYRAICKAEAMRAAFLKLQELNKQEDEEKRKASEQLQDPSVPPPAA